jgi:tyrosyl-tRNA synthetase
LLEKGRPHQSSIFYTLTHAASVQSRLNSQQGISFSEFSYQLLQAYDFLVLHNKTGCAIQIGGSDQWGNIIAGLELISRTCEMSNEASGNGDRAYGITTPLLTTSSGTKFGKSAGNAIWLNEELTTVYDFYQVGVIRCASFIDMTPPVVLYENK